MAKIKTKRERVKFASDNVAGACPEVLDAVLILAILLFWKVIF